MRPFTKFAARARAPGDIAPTLAAAVRAAVGGRPGAAYVDLPSDVLMAAVAPGELPTAGALDLEPVGLPPVGARQHAAAEAVQAAARLLRGAQRRACRPAPCARCLPRCRPCVQAGLGCCLPEHARLAGRPGFAACGLVPRRPPDARVTFSAQASCTGHVDHARTPAVGRAAGGPQRRARAPAPRS